MPRHPRIDQEGNYHIVNYGIEKNIFCDSEDYTTFLSYLTRYELHYQFKMHAYCLMNNYYHLLIETTSNNLSLIMKQLNYNYTMYFNKKYSRHGTLWQGRFKSWYVCDTTHFSSLIKYIEQCPIRNGISNNIGEFKWASANTTHIFLTQKEIADIDHCHHVKFVSESNTIIKQQSTLLANHFLNTNRNKNILNALYDGYRQSHIARFLKLSDVSISKIVKIEMQKKQLFNRLKEKGLFWSYDPNITYEKMNDPLFIEYILKYGDFDDIKESIVLFGKRQIKTIWTGRLKNNLQFIKCNLMIARVFFGMNVESNYFKGVTHERLKQLRLLASKYEEPTS